MNASTSNDSSADTTTPADIIEIQGLFLGLTWGDNPIIDIYISGGPCGGDSSGYAVSGVPNDLADSKLFRYRFVLRVTDVVKRSPGNTWSKCKALSGEVYHPNGNLYRRFP